MKRVLALILTLVLMAGIVACVSEPETEIYEPNMQEIAESSIPEIEEPDAQKIPEILAPDPEEEPDIFDAEDYVPLLKWTDGLRLTEPIALEVGDYFLNWRVIEVDTYVEGRFPVAFARFEGAVQVEGTLIFETYCSMFGWIGESLRFHVTGDADMLPLFVPDSRIVWFAFSLTEERQRLIEAIQSTLQPTGSRRDLGGYYWDYHVIENSIIVIGDYGYSYAPKGVVNVATLIEIIYIPGLDLP